MTLQAYATPPPTMSILTAFALNVTFHLTFPLTGPSLLRLRRGSQPFPSLC